MSTPNAAVTARTQIPSESPTDDARAERWACAAADHFEIRDISSGRFADPYRCNVCNP